MTTMATYTHGQVSGQSKKNKLLIIHSNKVYDVSDFAGRHPGGRELLEEHCWRDVSAVMRRAPHVHTRAAYNILQKYYVGRLEDQPFPGNQVEQNGNHIHVNGKNNVHVTNTETELTQPSPDQCLHGYRENELVDWNKPILWQVGKLGRNYNEWVHAPTDRPLRLFHSDFVEYFSATPWWVIPIVWIPVMLLFLLLSYLNFQRGPTIWVPGLYGVVSLGLFHMPILFSAGVLLWTLLEYVVHRWLFHMEPPHDSRFLITLHFLLHGQHHKCPFDKGRLVFPPVPGAVFAASFLMVYSWLFPAAVAYVLLAGTLAGYMGYDLTHYYLHHGVPSLNYFRHLKSYHVQHHFSQQHLGFGISSRLWDYPFGTLIKENSPKKVK